MKINGMNNAGGAPQAANRAGGQDDSYSRNIKNQIANAQKRLQEISSDQQLSTEEKMKKRQEIQQEIANLNQQLRQHQMEQRRQQQESKRTERASGSDSGNDGAGMEAMISADSSLKQAKVQGNMAKQAEGKAAVLKTEVKLDKNETTAAKKEKEIAELGERAQKATQGQMSSLADAGKEIEKAAKEGGEAKKAAGSDSKAEKTDGNRTDDKDRTSDEDAEKSAEEKKQAEEWPVYRSVDVRL